MDNKTAIKKIVLTGGGTAGHVTPILALLPALRERGCECHYIGSRDGIERRLAEEAGLPYYGISSGKLRRYLSAKNFSDMFRVVKGLSDASALIKKIKPDIVFSKGGFVTLPVVIAARLAKIPAVIHESDLTPGLANRLATPFADKVCVSFPETLKHIPNKKGVLTGTPIRKQLFHGSLNEGLRLCRFKNNIKPVVLFIGGSSGAASINRRVAEILPRLLNNFNVAHLCGSGNMPDETRDGYAAFEYAGEEMPHLYALADIVVSRAGANTIFELLALRKPSLLIPLSAKASRGDQILNAASFERQGYSAVLREENLTGETLLEAVNALYAKRKDYADRMSAERTRDAVENVINALNML
jgi:UDP-N-acetylglucosamine--N-acetylmuramyl-(pentapeptide) pyrophosphoryl-undecaprenol N-acetylglucosamine transferase